MPLSHPTWWALLPEKRTLRSAHNATLKHWRKLIQSRQWIVLEGLHLIQMYADRYEMPSVLIIPSTPSPQPEVIRWIEHTKTQEYAWNVEPSLIKHLSSLNSPPPLLGLAPYPQHTLPLSILNHQASLWLDGLQDPGNIGTLFRTALGAGIKHIICGQGCADPWSQKVLRAAQGAHFHLTLWQDCNLAETAQNLPHLPKWAAMPGGIPYFECTWTHPAMAIILGNEGHGVSSSILPYIDQTVGIPLDPALESLNVAIAGAILLFEHKRRHAAISFKA